MQRYDNHPDGTGVLRIFLCQGFLCVLFVEMAESQRLYLVALVAWLPESAGRPCLGCVFGQGRPVCLCWCAWGQASLTRLT